MMSNFIGAMRLVWVKEINLEKKLDNSEYRWLLEKIFCRGNQSNGAVSEPKMWGLKKMVVLKCERIQLICIVMGIISWKRKIDDVREWRVNRAVEQDRSGK